MKTMSAMEVRKHFGAVMDEVRLKSETVVLERAGKPIAMISPIGTQALEQGGKKRHRYLDALDHLSGLNSDHPRSDDLDGWLATERRSWEGRP